MSGFEPKINELFQFVNALFLVQVHTQEQFVVWIGERNEAWVIWCLVRLCVSERDQYMNHNVVGVVSWNLTRAPLHCRLSAFYKKWSLGFRPLICYALVVPSGRSRVVWPSRPACFSGFWWNLVLANVDWKLSGKVNYCPHNLYFTSVLNQTFFFFLNCLEDIS